MIIISFILMTLMFDSGVILKGEIRCSSPSGIKGLSLYQIKSAPSSSLNHQGSFFNFFSKSRKAKKKKNYHTSQARLEKTSPQVIENSK